MGEVKYTFIRKNTKKYSVKRLCDLLKVSRQAYYDWLKRGKSNRAIDSEILIEDIHKIYAEFKGRYGSPRIALELCRRGKFTSKNRVARHMQQVGLAALPWRKKKVMSRKPSAEGIAENLVKRVFDTKTKHILWVGDITYIPLQTGGFLYLAVWIDVFSRKVVGWAMQTRMTDQLVIDAFKQAIHKEHPPVGLMIHTDRGSQYTSRRFQAIVKSYGAMISMSRRGNPYDNAVMESFYKTLKRELMHDTKFGNAEEAKRAIFEYIEMFYNTKRMHSALGYKTPVEYELQSK
ncbi:IS3 family transposase [Paenibacillus alginolyticus]|uniref:IS3 family transposase n=1 Tax=Paenibacillus alginolyticus TaxID=59839 RepID=UPI000A04F3E5|nr:IS3 family transposase [Paenibacillus alginolyticus]MCY9669554.1 IS3 family transposase [Paenibacillus alginolyticus]